MWPWLSPVANVWNGVWSPNTREVVRGCSYTHQTHTPKHARAVCANMSGAHTEIANPIVPGTQK